ncbi:hypothetical protein HDA32_002615 [Spinactinospora alkalitolerans]|uniref:Uncharacterized protein n=1 Tax=Spinactinospora alkalitolerans TaxID=687207 RepID=A0A852TVS3_9ACTN|nr:hypothetical protein [Spinactinospora alkalitolerans]NYE47495.1 hypothetical protein [Spinactinospora alkalitolerans]
MDRTHTGGELLSSSNASRGSVVLSASVTPSGAWWTTPEFSAESRKMSVRR